MGDGLAYRYGVELEGPYQGRLTLIVPSVTLHHAATIRRALEAHSKTAEHLWLEALPLENFDWDAIVELAERYPITVQVRDDGDLPPSPLPDNVKMVWLVPRGYRFVAFASHYIKTLTGDKIGEGSESILRFQRFYPALYERDEVWPA